MITKTNITKLSGYVGLADRAGYIIWGVDNLKGYTHKMYLLLYRDDTSKTIQKAINRLSDSEAQIIKLPKEEFNQIVKKPNAKILAIKNKGISEQIINILRGEDG